MGIFDDIFGSGDSGSNPADAAMPYYNKIPGMEKDAYNPYIQRGNDAYNKFNPVYDRMSSDPAAFLQSIMDKFQPSKSYQLERDEATRAAGNSAAAGGMRGGVNDVSNQARITDSLMGNDMQQWLKNVMGIQDSGLSGEQHLYDTGYDATKALTGDMSNLYGTQGSLAFQGQTNQNQSHNDFMSGLMKMLGTVGGYEMPNNGGSVFTHAMSKYF